MPAVPAIEIYEGEHVKPICAAFPIGDSERVAASDEEVIALSRYFIEKDRDAYLELAK